MCARHREMGPGHFEMQTRHFETERRHLEMQPRHFEMERRRVETEPRHVETESGHVEMGSRHVEMEPRHVETATWTHPDAGRTPKGCNADAVSYAADAARMGLVNAKLHACGTKLTPSTYEAAEPRNEVSGSYMRGVRAPARSV